MASPNPNLSYLVTGRLAYGCDDLSAAFPHGGTALGTVGSCVFSPPSGAVRLPAEEDNTSQAVLFTGGDAVFVCSFESWDNDALTVPFNTATGGSGDQVISWPGTGTNAGETVTALEPLVFSPIRSDHPALIIYSAMPHLEVNAELRLSARFFLSIPMVFVGKPDDSSRVAAMGRLEDLSL